MNAAQQGMGQLSEPLPHFELTGEQAEQLTGGALPLQMRWLGLEAGQGCRHLHSFWAGVHTCTLSPTSSPTYAPEEVLPINAYCPQAQTRHAEGLALTSVSWPPAPCDPRAWKTDHLALASRIRSL